MGNTQEDRAEAQLRAGVYARLSETYDAAESVPTQLERGTDHAARRGWTVAATFKDDGFSGFKEITREGFGELIAAIEAGLVDVVIVRDVDRLTRNLSDWNDFEKACVRHGVRLSAYTGGDLDLSTPEGAYYGGMETLRAKRESAVKSARVRRRRTGTRGPGGARAGAGGGSAIPASTPTRPSLIRTSGPSWAKKLTRSRRTRYVMRRRGCWSTGSRFDRLSGTGHGAGSSR
jgi:site-specific DNA recombinase